MAESRTLGLSPGTSSASTPFLIAKDGALLHLSVATMAQRGCIGAVDQCSVVDTVLLGNLSQVNLEEGDGVEAQLWVVVG